MEDTKRSAVEINRHAPVIGSCEVEIAAAPEVAWDVLTAISGWPSWNPAVTSVSFDGEIGEGAAFRWKAVTSSSIPRPTVLARAQSRRDPRRGGA